MKRIIAFLLLLPALCCFSQGEKFAVTGKVTDAQTKQPLAGASVFCQNTTLGAITNADGDFILRLPRGGYDLVVSYTGYESFQQRISPSQADSLAIELQVRGNSLSEFTVSASTEVIDGLDKYGKFFFDHFIGTTPNAAQCKIDNPGALQFFFSKKRNRLKVKGREDLYITNEALGYKIRYQLDSFTYEYATDICTYTGFPFFEELAGTPEQKELWKARRSVAYNGSRLHFVRSWYDSTLADEGFRIEVVDTTKERLTTTPLENPYDSAFYTFEAGEVEINHPGRLRVIYALEMPDSSFLAENNLPAHLRAQITLLDVAEPFVIEQNGYFYEQAQVINTGYWSWEKVAEMLPYDYEPEAAESAE